MDGDSFGGFCAGLSASLPGCQNPETHDPAGGKTEQTETILALFEQNPLLRGLTLSGGEPLEQTEACLVLAKGTTEKGKDVILYTGYTWEQLVEKQKSDPILAELLSYVWLVIEGPFVLKLKKFSASFPGQLQSAHCGCGEKLAERSNLHVSDRPLENNKSGQQTLAFFC